MPRRKLKVSSPNYYVTITANNCIKIWRLNSVSHTQNEVGTLLTELSEPNYLKITYTAIDILDDDENLNNNNSLLVLGDKMGRIVLFNIIKSCKVLEISQHNSPINCVKFDDNKIITCSKDNKLCRWNLNGELMDTISVGDDIASCLVITHPFNEKKKKKNKYIMIGSNHINVWNITHKDHSKDIGSFQGHAHPIRYLLLSDDNQYLISSARDRFVYIWKCKSFYKKKEKVKKNRLKSALHSLALDDDVISMDIATIVKKEKNVYYIAAASKSTVYIWYFDVVLKPVVEISIDDDVDMNRLSWIQQIQFMNNTQLMVLRGTPSMPITKQIEFIHDTEFIGNIVLPNVSTNIINNTNNNNNNVMNAVDKDLRVLHVADACIPHPKLYKRKREDTEDMEPKTKKQRITFEDKLYEIEEKTKEVKSIPNADSLYTLLTQSLAANDETMFQRLLTMQNDEVMREFEGDIIENTLSQISCEMAIDLLQRLSEKLRVSPRQSISILRWLLPLLKSHAATFAKNICSRKHLISVHQAIDYQIKSLLPAIKLQGRLSLLMSQMEKVTQFAQNNNKPNIINGLEMARNKALFVHDEQTTN